MNEDERFVMGDRKTGVCGSGMGCNDVRRVPGLLSALLVQAILVELTIRAEGDANVDPGSLSNLSVTWAFRIPKSLTSGGIQGWKCRSIESFVFHFLSQFLTGF